MSSSTIVGKVGGALSASDQATVELTPAPVRIGPVAVGAGDPWPSTVSPQAPLLRDPEASPWDETQLRLALGQVPSLGELEAARLRARARAGLFGVGPTVRLGRLELIARIGSGGMGEVYTARDTELDRQVAVKLVRSDSDSRDATARIVREAQMMARVTHPNVVRIYDVGRIEDAGRIDSRVYITMEYVQGTTLRDWVEAAPRTWREILEHYVRAGRGLAAAHRTGLVHRDFKPSNVLVGDDDRVLVADFGLARSIAGDADNSETASGIGRMSPASPSRSAQPVTMQGAVVGTPGYMSPEQLQAAPVDARSDLFSFCVALYEALHGVRPYAGRTVQSLLAAIEAGEISPPMHTIRVPKRVEKAIARGLRAEPGRRYAAMDELLAELERALGRPGRALGLGAMVAVTLVAGSAGAGLGPFAAVDPCRSAGTGMAEIWSPAREQELRTRFAGTGLDFADAVAQRVATRLGEYASEWASARVDACEAAQVRHDQSLQLFDARMVCLERRRAAAGALVDALLVADQTTVEQAVDSVASLPAVEPCNDAEWLGRSVRPPETQELAVAVGRVRDGLARAAALYATGHDAEGLGLATGAVAAAASLDYEPVRAEALAMRGRLLVRLGKLEEGEATLLAAVELAEANRHDELAADLWLDMVDLATRGWVDPGRGDAWIARARASQRRIGDPAARRVRVLMEEGILDFVAQRHAASERALRTAMALHEAVGGDARLGGRLALQLANTLEAQGKFAESRAMYEQALATFEAAVGADHPDYGRVLYNLAKLLLLRQGDAAGAEERLAAAVAIYVRSYGPAHHLIGRAEILWVEAANRRGAFAEAVKHAEAAARIYGEVLPADHRDRVDAEIALGAARFFAGELASALAAFERAGELQRRVQPVDPIQSATIACDMGETQVALARHAEARASFAEVETWLARAPVRDLDLEARVLTGRGQIALAEGEGQRAVPLLAAAVALRRQLPDDPLAMADLQDALKRAQGR